ncbi:PP_RS20740 family protein [Methylomonas sp. TEB]|uniref:PP_RS20740 family protein n=1 Tax=Methylomonas sp. TEB TaxID=3398229 RepID=UPI0039F5DC53
MENNIPVEEGLADDIVGEYQYEAPQRQKKEFLPWHRPRKQFVRDRQWRSEIVKLVEAAPPIDGVIKYLGLPGLDLLDLRYFHNTICERQNLKLRFLGFNTAAAPNDEAQTEFNLCRDEVKRLEQIDPLSDVIRDDFRLVGNPNSKAFKETAKLGPYDVVNLDLCDGFAKHPPGHLDGTHYDAMSQLLSIQARNKNPWLLFLTTRVGNNDIHRDVLDRLLDKYRENLINCTAFREKSFEHFSIQNNDDLLNAIQTEPGLTNIFLTGICKWLLSCSINQTPPTKVKLISVFGYRVSQDANHEDLISLAIKFEPCSTAVADPFGLANHQGNRPTECELSPNFVAKVANRKDADNILSTNDQLHGEMITAMADLLSLARYDTGAFQSWVNAGCPAQ